MEDKQLNTKQKEELHKLAAAYYEYSPDRLGMSIDDLTVDTRNRIAKYHDHDGVFANMGRYLNDVYVKFKYIGGQ